MKLTAVWIDEWQGGRTKYNIAASSLEKVYLELFRDTKFAASLSR